LKIDAQATKKPEMMTHKKLLQVVSTRIIPTKASISAALQAGMYVLQSYLKPPLLPTAVLFLLLSFPGSITGQEVSNGLEVRVGIGVANQKWKPYDSKELMIKGETQKNPFLSIAYVSKIHRLLAVRTGMAVKWKGTQNIETPNHSYQSSSFYKPPSPRVYTSYLQPALSAMGTFMFFPYGHANGGLYLSSGLSVDYLLGKKPMVHEVFPYNVTVHFDENDYRRMTAVATFGVGFELVRNLFLEFEYATDLTHCLNVRQMQIKDSFYSFSLVFINLRD
jgi:hypothetical protein